MCDKHLFRWFMVMLAALFLLIPVMLFVSNADLKCELQKQEALIKLEEYNIKETEKKLRLAETDNRILREKLDGTYGK